MFDTFMGLPLHVLVLHVTVVLIPLGAVAVAAVFCQPVWRQRYGRVMVGVSLGMLVLAFVTVQAGQELQNRFRRIGDTNVPRDDHEMFGRALLWIVLALAVATALAALADRQGAPAALGTGFGVIVAALAVASIVLTVIAGHTGSKSHWEQFVDGTDSAGTASAVPG